LHAEWGALPLQRDVLAAPFGEPQSLRRLSAPSPATAAAGGGGPGPEAAAAAAALSRYARTATIAAEGAGVGSASIRWRRRKRPGALRPRPLVLQALPALVGEPVHVAALSVGAQRRIPAPRPLKVARALRLPLATDAWLLCRCAGTAVPGRQGSS